MNENDFGLLGAAKLLKDNFGVNSELRIMNRDFGLWLQARIVWDGREYGCEASLLGPELDLEHRLRSMVDVLKATLRAKVHGYPMSPEEAAIIASAVENALCWGTGILTTCQENLEDAGFEWTPRHEQYVFENYIDE